MTDLEPPKRRTSKRPAGYVPAPPPTSAEVPWRLILLAGALTTLALLWWLA